MHACRLAQRWGLTKGHTVEQTEADLKVLFPEDSWRDLHLQIIYFGERTWGELGGRSLRVCSYLLLLATGTSFCALKAQREGRGKHTAN